MTGVLVGQIMIAVGAIDTDCTFGMVVRCRRLAEEEIVSPEHMLGLDHKTGIGVVLDTSSPSASQFLGRRRFAAEHIVLGPSAQGREKTRLVSDLLAKFLSALESGEHFRRAPAAS